MNLNLDFYDFIITNDKNISNSNHEIYYIESNYANEFIKTLKEYIIRKYN